MEPIAATAPLIFAIWHTMLYECNQFAPGKSIRAGGTVTSIPDGRPAQIPRSYRRQSLTEPREVVVAKVLCVAVGMPCCRPFSYLVVSHAD